MAEHLYSLAAVFVVDLPCMLIESSIDELHCTLHCCILHTWYVRVHTSYLVYMCTLNFRVQPPGLGRVDLLMCDVIALLNTATTSLDTFSPLALHCDE